MKKIIALVLALVLCFGSAISVAAEAKALPDVTVDEFVSAIKKDVEGIKTGIKSLKKLTKSLINNLEPYMRDVVLTEDNVQTAFNLGQRLLAKIIDKLTNPGAEPSDPGTEPSDPGTEPSDPGTEPSDPGDEPALPDGPATLDELSNILKKYIFVKVEDYEAATGKAIEDADFTYKTLDDGSGTVYIAVNIEDNPDIFNYVVFRNVVEKLYESQGEALITNDDGSVNYLMSYEHIAGELAFHALVYAVTGELIEITGTKNETIVNLYEHAAQADLNIDEARVPVEVLSILGVLLVDFVQFNVLKLFGII